MFVKRLIDNRDAIFNKYSKEEIVERYKKNYGLSEAVSFDQIRQHAELEGVLTDELLRSTPENRHATFHRAYSRLYSGLPWLSGTGTSGGGDQWAALLRPGSSVYEVGSGAGYLVNYLGQKGFKCIGTDLSTEREREAVSDEPNVTWNSTDGVKLTQFAEKGAFDYIISDQVVEHLHPEDIVTHFKEARELLKPGGSYIVRTPYAYYGPADLSKIFGVTAPLYMHLHEFDYDEMMYIKHVCGYSSAKAVFRYRRLSIFIASAFYMRCCVLMDKIQKSVDKTGRYADMFRTIRGLLLLPRGVWVVLTR